MTRRIAAFAALVLPLLLSARAWADEGPAVVVSIKPIHSLAAAVMKGVAEPKLLVSGGQSPHTYALKPSDARTLKKAALVFWVGPTIESFLIGPLSTLEPSARVVTLIDEPRLTRYPVRAATFGESAPLSKSEAQREATDGHIWLDPRNAMVIVTRMQEELAARDPAHAYTYAENAAATKARLAALDRALEARLAPLRAKPFVVFHDAYQYFETRYGLSSVGALAINPEIQPGARTVARLKEKIVAERVVCAFVEPQFPPKLMAAVTRGTGARQGTLDPEGAALAPGAELYFLLLDNLAGALTRCLQPIAAP